MLRNCDWVIALVVNTGPDTKIMMSSPETSHKFSLLSAQVSTEITRVFLFLFVLCVLGSCGQLLYVLCSVLFLHFLVCDVSVSLY